MNKVEILEMKIRLKNVRFREVICREVSSVLFK